MSRAFVREVDDAPVPPMPERPISAAPNLVTPEGAVLIAAELEAIDSALAEGAGDTEALLRDQRYWSARQASMQVVDAPSAPDAVAFGARVNIRRRGKTLSLVIVGEDEADPAEGLIAWTSPLAHALDGAEPGEEIEFEAGGQMETIAVLGVGKR